MIRAARERLLFAEIYQLGLDKIPILQIKLSNKFVYFWFLFLKLVETRFLDDMKKAELPAMISAIA
ncbi:hypothetical protein QUB68_05880 [Microcoleus sp. A006_D1]|uniref:hypothetical protein n=1 Tax=Microcoleus sp. A006_D1 TaxID=3055267 RepID=UPI002FD34C39